MGDTTEALALVCAKEAFTHATHPHTLQLDMMLHAEHGMFRMQPQEKTQEDFKFWSTQPMLKLGTKYERMTGMRMHGRLPHPYSVSHIAPHITLFPNQNRRDARGKRPH
jgi:hypothetical protein